MKPTIEQEAPNKTIVLLRRLVAEKQETKRQMRESFENDPAVQRIIQELDNLNAERKHRAV